MSPTARLLATLGISLAAALSTASAALATCGGTTATAAAQSQTQIEESVLCLINDQREAAGLSPLWPKGQLRSAGLDHSTEMVSQGYFAHTSPAGVGFVDRIAGTGYTTSPKFRSWTVGENLGWGTGSQSTPAALVQAWMQSPPHRANILRPRFREIGVAAVKGTPINASDAGGVTVSTEYGFRAKKKRKA